MFGYDGETPALGAVEEAPSKGGAETKPVLSQSLLVDSYKVTHDKSCGEIVLPTEKSDEITLSDYNNILRHNAPMDGILLDDRGFIKLINGVRVNYAKYESHPSLGGCGFAIPVTDGDVLILGDRKSNKAIKVFVAKDFKWIEAEGKATETAMMPDLDIEAIKEEVYQEGYDMGAKETRQKAYDEGYVCGQADYEPDWEAVNDYIIERRNEGEQFDFNNLNIADIDDNTSRVILEHGNDPIQIFFVNSYHPSDRENEFSGDFEYAKDVVVTKDGLFWTWNCDSDEWIKMVEGESEDDDSFSEKVADYIDEGNDITINSLDINRRDDDSIVVDCYKFDGGRRFIFSDWCDIDDAERYLPKDFDSDRDILITKDGLIHQWDREIEEWCLLQL